MSWPRLTDRQLDTLRLVGNPGWVCLSVMKSDRVWASLARRGLIAPDRPPRDADDPGGGFRITPAGLRALADALEAGRFERLRPGLEDPAR